MLALVMLVLYVAFTSGGLIAIKLGTAANQHFIHLGEKIAIPFNIPIVSGVLLYGLSFLLYIYLISRFELGYIIPLTTALVYTVIFVASFLIFKEAFTALKIVAICLIIGGLILLNIK